MNNSQKLFDMRLAQDKQRRTSYHQSQLLSQRLEIQNNLYPLHSPTLSPFHHIVSPDLLLYQPQILSTLLSTPFSTLPLTDYQLLIYDLKYLVSHKNFHLPYLPFLPDYQSIFPYLLSIYHQNFHPKNVNETLQVMTLEQRSYLYLSVVEDEKLEKYIRKEMVEMACEDMGEDEGALGLVEYCLERGVRVREVEKYGVKRVYEGFVKKEELGLGWMMVAYYLAVRGVGTYYFEFLEKMVERNLGKFRVEQEEVGVFGRTLEKFREIMRKNKVGGDEKEKEGKYEKEKVVKTETKKEKVKEEKQKQHSKKEIEEPNSPERQETQQQNQSATQRIYY